ncbi:hypothetical protein D5086_007996 [Populus alba]|uniref:Uncharacterized protein n=2 Tax=Populus TaxID=3689 RepID=A0ACC4CEE9_POPAL|nr:hypothetical protein NC653_010480 [Populus alba x Populus x berolinensis]
MCLLIKLWKLTGACLAPVIASKHGKVTLKPIYDGKLNIWNVVDGSHLQTLNSPISPSDDNNENWPPTQRIYLTMAPIGTRLYFLAGYRKAGESSRIMSMALIFDTTATRRAWASSEPMEEEGVKELCSHCCVVRISETTVASEVTI